MNAFVRKQREDVGSSGDVICFHGKQTTGRVLNQISGK
jgi:hypothetical protein